MDSKKRLHEFARDVLSTFEKIVAAAERIFEAPISVPLDAFVSVNTLTDARAIQAREKELRERQDGYRRLLQEPAVARITTSGETGESATYYVCRSPEGLIDIGLISYLTPVGQLASRDVGEEYVLPNGRVVEVIEKSLFHPLMRESRWDSRDTYLEGDRLGPLTIESLRLLLERAVRPSDEDKLSQLLAEVQQEQNVFDGARRRIRTKMELRDQPILDRYQDEIFRLPMDARLLILGPPGTGKTTTLIRRLRQKTYLTLLSPEEKSIVEGTETLSGLDHAQNWVMFTPTELLRQYLKEAFAREGVPAPEQRIRTWPEFRRELARNTYGILRSATGRGTLVLKENVAIVQAEAIERSIPWYEDFEQWQKAAFLEEMRAAAQRLSDSNNPVALKAGRGLLSAIDGAGKESAASLFIAFSAEGPALQALAASLKEQSDAGIHGALNLQMNRDNDFMDKLVAFIDSMDAVADEDVDEMDDQDAEDEDTPAPRVGKGAAINAYMKALRAQARAAAMKRSPRKESRAGRILEWLGERSLPLEVRAALGESLIVQSNARRFVNPTRRFIDGIPRRYRAFRRQRQNEGTWYTKEGWASTDISPLEIDLILLAILKGSIELLSRQQIAQNVDSAMWSSLKPALGLFRNQVLVDEATDFSPIQLACMYCLTYPRLRSFFACGDFNQRLTLWGSRSPEDINWAVPSVDTREITVTYRQSKELNEFARALIRATGGADQHVALPKNVDNEGVRPVLYEGASSDRKLTQWVSDRVREIEHLSPVFPSIAVFVNSEGRVASVADSLNSALAEHNIQVVACPEGRVIGQDSDIRVFDVQHIKGLEFEAVFFTGVDELATLHPQLFEKYLYVGTTRASMYLGIACITKLPAKLEPLRSLFGEDWKLVN